jgi:hypothetical protein
VPDQRCDQTRSKQRSRSLDRPHVRSIVGRRSRPRGTHPPREVRYRSATLAVGRR